VSGALLLAAQPAWAGNATDPPEMAFQASTGDLWEACTGTVNSDCIGGTTGGLDPIDTGLAMAAGTSPALAYTTFVRGSYEVAFQGSNGDLWTTGTYGTQDLGLRMMPGTSPAIAQIAQDGETFAIAFQDVDAQLVTTVLTPTVSGVPSVSTKYWGLPMDTKSSPAIAGVPSNGYEVAYHDSTKDALALAGTLSTGITDLGMAGDTSPSIATVSGGYQIAFQADGGDLWTTGTLGTGDLGLGMDNATSPSIAGVSEKFYPALSSTYEIAFQANTGHLWTTGDAGLTSGDTGQVMAAGTSPAIRGTEGVTTATAGHPSTVSAGYTVAYQNSTGSLSYYDVLSGQPVNTGLGMDNATSPAAGGGNQF
jgi:hypothetical protein